MTVELLGALGAHGMPPASAVVVAAVDDGDATSLGRWDRFD